jgi:glycosyltransferase involved in cell wall biosynthesis
MNPSIKATVSCIIPVHNGERFLSESLESVMAQSHPIHEVIVVDDGSTDGTRALVEAYAAHPATLVRYLWQENGGPAAARNAGIQAAVGDFIAFLDADDLWLPEKTARQLQRFAARPELFISMTKVQNFWMDEVRAEEERMQGHARARAMAGYVAQAILARRSAFAQIGLFDAAMQHTSIAKWFLLVEEAGFAIELLPEILVLRRLHLDNRSRKLANNSRMEYLRLFQTMRTRKRAVVQP